jgi:serine/threonine protein kinase
MMTYDDLVGRTLGQYELRELLGVGGMGAVYRAYERSLKREVAVKVLTSTLASQPDYIERFNREAQAVAALQHPNIIPIYFYGTQGTISYLVMPLLDGGTLALRLQQRDRDDLPLPSLGEIADQLRQLASALDYAHSRGIIHRDIKATNVMFDNHGRPYLMDFGIAKLLGATVAITDSGVVMGTPSYMPPEQWRSEPVTAATDQYSLGVLVYSMVTGRLPFESPTPHGLMYQHLNESPPPVQSIRQDVPESVTPVLERALAKRPTERFPIVEAFANAFDDAIHESQRTHTGFFAFKVDDSLVHQPTARPGTPPSFLLESQPTKLLDQRPLYRKPLFWIGAVVILVAIAVLAVALTSGGNGNDLDTRQTQLALDLTSQALTEPAVAVVDTDTPTNTATDTATATEVSTDTPTHTEEPTDTPTNTTTNTDTPTNTATFTDTPTNTATATNTEVPTDTPTNTATDTATVTEVPTDTPANTDVPSDTPTNTALPTNTPTNTERPTNTPTDTPTATEVPVVPTEPPSPCQLADVNGNGAVDIFDLRLLARAYGTTEGDEAYSADFDFDDNGVINILDLRRISSQYGQTCSAGE